MIEAAGFGKHIPSALKGGSWMKSLRWDHALRHPKHPVPWCFYGGVSKRLDIGGCDIPIFGGLYRDFP